MQPESLSRAFLRLREAGVQVDGADVRIADVGQLASYVRTLETAVAH